MIMDSSKNGRLIITFKKFRRSWVKDYNIKDYNIKYQNVKLLYFTKFID